MTAPDPAGLAAPAGARQRSSGRWLAWLLALAALAAAGWFGWQKYTATPAPDLPKKSGAKGFGKDGPRATPVVAVPARAGDMPIQIAGLGTVTPLRTVTVKSRVAGQLLRLHFAEGQSVREGQLLAEIDPRPFEVQLAQAEGQMARDRALLENARVDLERYAKLFEQDSIARQQVDTQAALVRQYEGATRVNQSQIDNAKLQIVYSRITSPATGRTGLRQVDAGNMISGNEPNGLVVITQLQPISVVFSVPQDQLPAIMKRTRAGEKLPVEAWDREQKTLLARGVLASVDNLIDPTTGTVKLKAEFHNRDDALFPNQFVNARMQLDTLRDVTLMPAAALQRSSQGVFVYVVNADRTVSVRGVTLGPTDGTTVVVETGLRSGEVVVIDGMDRLREGALVEVTTRPEIRQTLDGKATRERKKGDGTPPREGAKGEGPKKGPPAQ